MRAGLLDGGITGDFEDPDITPDAEECAWLRSCNLLISTGAIGYVTERTLDAILPHLGKDHPGEFGPLVVVTILRMFDLPAIPEVFEKHGFMFGRVPGVRLPQRRFTDAEERRKVLSLLHERGIDTGDWEDRGKHFADLYIAAPRELYPLLKERMMEASEEREASRMAAYIRR